MRKSDLEMDLWLSAYVEQSLKTWPKEALQVGILDRESWSSWFFPFELRREMKELGLDGPKF